jgi:hypothetical protein
MGKDIILAILNLAIMDIQIVHIALGQAIVMEKNALSMNVIMVKWSAVDVMVKHGMAVTVVMVVKIMRGKVVFVFKSAYMQTKVMIYARKQSTFFSEPEECFFSQAHWCDSLNSI